MRSIVLLTAAAYCLLLGCQAQLLAALGQPAALPPSPAKASPPADVAPPPAAVAAAGETESGAAALPTEVPEELAEKV